MDIIFVFELRSDGKNYDLKCGFSGNLDKGTIQAMVLEAMVKRIQADPRNEINIGTLEVLTSIVEGFKLLYPDYASMVRSQTISKIKQLKK
jgi:hypothetical protein